MTKKKILEEMGKLEERVQALEAADTLVSEDAGSAVSQCQAGEEPASYVVNTHHGVFHRADCHYLRFCYDEYQRPVNWTREECIAHKLKPCKVCKA